MIGLGIAALAWGRIATAADSGPPADQGAFVHGGSAGFVVTDFAFALSKDATETGACPHGWTLGLREEFAAMPDGQRHDGESEQDYSRRLAAGAQKLATAPNGQNTCMNPEAAAPDPNWRTVDAPNVPAYGIDLDGQDSHAKGKPAPGTCAHDDFRGFNGERGIDNQFFRVVGCSRSYQPTGQSWDNTIELRTGSWGVLITLDGVNDIRNAPNVQVGIYASADPIQLSPTREPVTFATYSPMQDPRFRANTRGRIVNGVLTTQPVDVRFYKVTNSMYIERVLRHARLQVTDLAHRCARRLSGRLCAGGGHLRPPIRLSSPRPTATAVLRRCVCAPDRPTATRSSTTTPAMAPIMRCWRQRMAILTRAGIAPRSRRNTASALSRRSWSTPRRLR
jgi:hypothetical protein